MFGQGSVAGLPDTVENTVPEERMVVKASGRGRLAVPGVHREHTQQLHPDVLAPERRDLLGEPLGQSARRLLQADDHLEGASLAALVLVSLMTKPPAPERVERFFPRP